MGGDDQLITDPSLVQGRPLILATGGGYEYRKTSHERAAPACVAALVGGPRRECRPCPDAVDAHVAGRLALSRCFGRAVDEDRRIEWPQVPHGCLASRRHRAISCCCRAAWRI